MPSRWRRSCAIGPEGYSVEGGAIRQLVDVATANDPRYTPNVARREARKLKTQALHESWRKEYRALKQSHPGMSDVWYSQADCQDGHCPEAKRRNDPQKHEAIKKLGGIFSPRLPPEITLYLAAFRGGNDQIAASVMRLVSFPNTRKAPKMRSRAGPTVGFHRPMRTARVCLEQS